jgi:DNA-binding transcriptional ArsR family regulator
MMVSMPPIIEELARDYELGGRDMQIWIVAVPHLDLVEFRELSLDDIAKEFGADDSIEAVSRPTISRSLLRLVERGYLELHETRGERRVRRFRIPLRRIYPRPATFDS